MSTQQHNSHEDNDGNTVQVSTHPGVFVSIVATIIMSVACPRQRNALHTVSNAVKLFMWITVCLYQTNITSVSPFSWQFLLTLPMSAQHGAALPHRPSPPGEQRWLPAASTLVFIDHARYSSDRTRDHQWPCIQFNCSSCMGQFANSSADIRVTGHFSTPPEN